MECVEDTFKEFDDELGALYLQNHPEFLDFKTYDPTTTHIFNDIKRFFHDRIERADWLTPSSKDTIQNWLSEMAFDSSYSHNPSQWSSKNIVDGNFFATEINLKHGGDFFENYENDGSSEMTHSRHIEGDPIYYNAQYSSYYNKVGLYGGAMRSPIFNASATVAMNYGSLGRILGI